jgi:hypothetical protein
VPLCPPQIPHGLTPGSNPGLRGGRPATNRLSHGTANLFIHSFNYSFYRLRDLMYKGILFWNMTPCSM